MATLSGGTYSKRRLNWAVRFAILTIATVAFSSAATAAIVEDGIPNIDDDRLYAWYDGNEAIGADGDGDTPVWPNRQGDPDRDITSGFGGDDFILEPVEMENGHMGLRYFDVVTWRDAEWGELIDNFTVFVAANVRDPDFAYFFTGNQGGGGAEANANFQLDDLDMWSMKAEFREPTAPLTDNELQYHTFLYNEDGLGRHYIGGELQAEVDIGVSSLSGFVLGGRQNGFERASVDFAEVIVVEDALNDDDRMAIEGYLDNKFFGGSGLPGDYDRNGVVEAADADLQAAAMASPNPDLDTFDENMDGAVDALDREIWVHDHAGTWFGDANLDLVFDSADFVDVFTKGKYETGQTAGWDEGDWSGDLVFDSSDFVNAFTDGGYELGPRPAVAAVPEPAGGLLLGIALVVALSRQTIVRRA